MTAPAGGDGHTSRRAFLGRTAGVVATLEIPEWTPRRTATPSATPQSTPTEASTPSPTEGTGPGLGVGTALAGVAGFGLAETVRLLREDH